MIIKKYLPIKEEDVKRYIGYCEEWNYGNKDTCKYVSKMLTEDLQINCNWNYKTSIKYWDNFMSLAHSMNSGGSFYPIETKTGHWLIEHERKNK